MNTNVRITIVIVAGFIGGGCATTAGNAHRSTAADTYRACSPESGSRISPAAANSATPGRCYTEDDIRRTGATTVGDALALLDPAITVGR